MRSVRLIVWDLETVPDMRGYAAANDMSASTDKEVREAIGDKFPKHIYHSIVCIATIQPSCSRCATSAGDAVAHGVSFA